MDTLKRLNLAVEYIEAHLLEEPDLESISRVTLCSSESFQRFFSYLTQMTVSDYIRRRRLTLAAYELASSDIRILDAAVKYGYRSADAFSRAFKKQHGILPSRAREPGARLCVCPPLTFCLTVNGADPLMLHFVETEEIVLLGLSRQLGGSAGERYEQVPDLWTAECENLPSLISPNRPGIWYGIWDHGRYHIARAPELTFGGQNASPMMPLPLQALRIPKGRYAVFTGKGHGIASDVLPRLRRQIFEEWLPSSGFSPTEDYEIEVYHLYPPSQREQRSYEIWLRQDNPQL